MEDARNATSGYCQSLARNAQNDPSRKRQKTSDSISALNPPNDNEEISAAAI
jgi:hypothetical protein